MTITAYAQTIIRKKRRWFPEMPASMHDFILGDVSPLDAQHIPDNPQVSMYCADMNNKKIVFVETPPGVDLLTPPFYYLAQYEHAVRVITLSFDDCIRLAEPLPYPDKKFLLLYTVGRAGSTLLAKIFAGDPDTLSVSEPDVLSDFTSLAASAHQDREYNEKLLLAYFKLFAASPATAGKQRILIKLRGYAIELAEMISSVLPDSRGIFLYRNARPVIESFIRAFSIIGVMSRLRDTVPFRLFLIYLFKRNQPLLLDYFPVLSEYSAGTIYKTGWPGFLCIAWISVMKAYVSLHRKNLAIKALLYEDIIKSPQEVISRLFSFCGMPASCLSEALKALEKDSQEGTRLARSIAHKKQWQVKAINVEHLGIILRAQPEINAPDYIAPGTILHETGT